MQAYNPVQDLKIKSQEKFQKILTTLQFWQFSQEKMVLSHRQIDYQIDLTSFKNDSEILDLIIS